MDNLDDLYFVELKFDDDDNSIAVASKADFKLVSYDRLVEIHSLIYKSLQKREAYEAVRNFMAEIVEIKRNEVTLKE